MTFSPVANHAGREHCSRLDNDPRLDRNFSRKAGVNVSDGVDNRLVTNVDVSADLHLVLVTCRPAKATTATGEQYGLYNGQICIAFPSQTQNCGELYFGARPQSTSAANMWYEKHETPRQQCTYVDGRSHQKLWRQLGKQRLQTPCFE